MNARQDHPTPSGGRPPFPRHTMQGTARTHVPSAPERSTAYTMVYQDASLIFRENNTMRMDYRIRSRYVLNRALRFIVRSGHWTGAGVQGYPWIFAKVGERRLSARVHGRPYWDGNQRAYLIDLGDEFPSGTQLDLLTDTLYVDEFGQFDPYLAHNSPNGIAYLNLTVAFKSPPDCVVYYMKEPQGDGPLEPADVPRTNRFGLAAFSLTLSDCPPGVHCLAW